MTRVRTVAGDIDSSSLGVTLFHEHILLDGAAGWREAAPDDAEGREMARVPVRMEFLNRLHNDPYLSLDNTRLDSIDDAVTETGYFAALGGRTIIDVTLDAIGRDPQGLREIAERTGLNIIMGSGFYLERGHPPELASMTVADVENHIVNEVEVGVEGIRAGVIGEIGVGLHFAPSEEKVLRGAARAQVRTGVPLTVHIPAWLRYGHRVLDIVEEEGCNPHAVVLCHMNPSAVDPAYQRSLADRGAWIEYDMLGMDYYYPGEGQSPSDTDNATAIAGLVADGYAGSLLMSHDIFFKTLLRRYGGGGYSHVLANFVPRLERHGVSRETSLGILTDNPRAVFESAAKGERR